MLSLFLTNNSNLISGEKLLHVLPGLLQELPLLSSNGKHPANL